MSGGWCYVHGVRSDVFHSPHKNYVTEPGCTCTALPYVEVKSPSADPIKEAATNYVNGPDNGTDSVLETLLRVMAVRAWELGHDACLNCGNPPTGGCKNPFVKETQT